MSKVQAQTKSVKQLLSKVRYGIDFYQRSYVWERRHVEELLDDFESRFLDNYHQAQECFDKAALAQRQRLYRQLCEHIWNPDRLKQI